MRMRFKEAWWVYNFTFGKKHGNILAGYFYAGVSHKG
jgi:hypothetical protein